MTTVLEEQIPLYFMVIDKLKSPLPFGDEPFDPAMIDYLTPA